MAIGRYYLSEALENKKGAKPQTNCEEFMQFLLIRLKLLPNAGLQVLGANPRDLSRGTSGCTSACTSDMRVCCAAIAGRLWDDQVGRIRDLCLHMLGLAPGSRR